MPGLPLPAAMKADKKRMSAVGLAMRYRYYFEDQPQRDYRKGGGRTVQ